MSPTNPTAKTYAVLNRAFDFFNVRLFAGELLPCLVTLQRKNTAYDYFAGGQFGSKDGTEITDEIARNPSYFKSRTDEQSLSTLSPQALGVQSQWKRLTVASLMVRFIRSTCPLVQGCLILVSLCWMPFSSQTRSKMWWNA